MRPSRYKDLTTLIVLFLCTILVVALAYVDNRQSSGEYHSAPVAAVAVADPVPPHPSYLPRPAPTHQASRSRPIATPRPTRSPHRVQRRQIALREPVGSLKSYASGLVGDPVQYDCLDRLWDKESGWSVTESYGDAYGIPQALPGDKMASEGSDWRTNGRTQIRWGLSYIRGRWRTMCAAWDHWLAHHWY